MAIPPPVPPAHGRHGIHHRHTRWAVVAAAITVVAVSTWSVVRRDGGPSRNGTSAEQMTITPTTPTVPPSTSAPTTTAGATTTVEAAGPDAGRVDIGAGVEFALPSGFALERSADGVTITNGTSHVFAAVTTTGPGADPMPALQARVGEVDARFDAVATTPAMPLPVDTAGDLAIDGYRVEYRAMSAAGDGIAGIVEVRRRADGLVGLVDRFTSLDDAPTAAMPDSMLGELATSFGAAPQVGPAVDLPPLAPTRLATVHPTCTVDGVVAVSPPPGWVIDAPGPLRVVLSKADGSRLVVSRLADASAPDAAALSALADLTTAVPDAAPGAFAPVRADGVVVSAEAPFIGSVGGVPHEGSVRIWVDTVTGAVFSMAAHHPVGGPWSELDREFVLQPLDASIAALP